MKSTTMPMPEKLDLKTLRWLLVAQIAVIIPHLQSLPLWLVGLAIILTGWRFSSFYGYGRLPGPFVRASLVMVGIGLMYSTYQIKFTVEAAVAFFALTYALKVLEVRQRRDLYLFIFLSFFLLALKFLFDQTLWTSLYVMGAVGICLAGLVVIANPSSSTNAGKTAFRLMWQAIPLVLIAYLLFPRVAPLWSVPLTTEKNWTGISDRINPGDISDLAQNSARAFRVRFEGAVPRQEELYWRGLILDRYEDGEWSVSDLKRWKPQPLLSDSTTAAAPDFHYEVIQEPTGKPWGFALDHPLKMAGDYGIDPDGLIRFRKDLIHPTRYQIGSLADTKTADLTALERAQYLALPANENPVTRAWISQLSAGHDSPNDLVWAVMRYFREQPFFYTLRPPPHSGDQVDQFLFQTQRGFCAHFAGAFTFVLRAAGVPARMVLGYQGGEWNAEGGYLMVHQYDAHAWVEVWLDGTGWTRFDPTAVVAPNRIEQGIREAMAAEGSFLEGDPFSLDRYDNLGVARWLRLSMDRANYNWQRWVVQYDEETQLQFFQRWYEQIELKTLGLWLASLMGVLIAIALGWLLVLERNIQHDPVKRAYLLYEKRLAKYGLRRKPGETPRLFTDRASQRYPKSAAQIRKLHRRLETLLYGPPEKLNVDEVRDVRRAVKRLKLQ